MALKYFIDYNDINGINHRVDISNDDFVGAATEITGNIIYQFPEVDNVLQAVRGSGLILELDASVDNDFTDFIDVNERSFVVTYTRNSVLEFNGYIKTEGIFQDYVTDKWLLSISCVDGLDYLKNLAYVDSTTFVPFTGKQSMIQVISNCLKRTGFELDIYVDVDIQYTGFIGSDRLGNVYVNADRFQKDDGSTIMNCDEVLRSIIEPYNACVVQQQGKWWVFKPNQLTSGSPNPTFTTYDSDGVFTGTLVYDVFETIYSDIDKPNDSTPFWVNANQQLQVKNSLSAYRINYKYGFVKSFLTNILLESLSDTNIPEYTINDGSFLTFPPNRLGVIINCLSDGGDKVLTSDSFTVSSGDRIEFKTRFTTELNSDCSYAVYSIKLTGTSNNYFLQPDGSWNTGNDKLRIFNGIPNPGFIPPEQEFVGSGAELLYTNESDDLPESGTIEVQIYTGGIYTTGGDNAGTVTINEVSLSPLNPSDTNLVGEFHTVQRAGISSKIENNKEVFNGDTPTDVYIGTIYKSNQTTPTETWFRNGVSESKELLRIMGEDTLRMSQKPHAIFQGDVWGYLDYIKSIIINKYPTSGQTFFPLSMSYNVNQNVTSYKLRQLFSDELGDIVYEKTFDYGETVKPTIVG